MLLLSLYIVALLVDIYVISFYNKIDIYVYFIIKGGMKLCPKLVINIWKNVR